MIDLRSAAVQHAHENRQRFLSELSEFVAIPSISTDPEAKIAMQRAAEWVANRLKSLGMNNIKIMPTGGHPVVYADYLQAGPQAPTVLVYGHYDVQPAEPLELWQSGAFDPQVRGEHLYGRGATDMKGQTMVCVAAVESILSAGPLPVNLKWLVEGEEEIGSPNLENFIAAHKDMLACDVALNPDSGTLSADFPTITYALRGLAYFEIRLTGPAGDLHSGTFGGAVHNPAQVLCELVAGMHDDQGRVTLPGFYDRVRPLEAEERAQLARLPVDEAFVLKQAGVSALWGEAGFTPAERLGARPTLEVNGLLSGFTGEGSKTVLPAKAMAKISCRLVPDQDPAEVRQSLLRYLEQHAPKTVRYEVLEHASSPASISNRRSAAIKAMQAALYTVWGIEPLFRREGGSVPVVGHFKNYLGVESVNTGFSLPGDNMHAPNEKVHLPTWYRGMDAFIHFFLNLGGE